MFGRFLELGIATPDIAASVQFYERLGFTQLLTGDAWPHRYGVLSDKWGNRWAIATHKEDVLPEEMGVRAAEAMKNMPKP